VFGFSHTGDDTRLNFLFSSALARLSASAWARSASVRVGDRATISGSLCGQKVKTNRKHNQEDRRAFHGVSQKKSSPNLLKATDVATAVRRVTATGTSGEPVLS
jgi:hypothetical protein